MKNSQSSSENEKAEEDADEENEKTVKDFDTENEKTQEDDDEENELVNKFSKVKLYHDKNISNTYSKLFIQIDREKRYEIQACKKFK